METTKQKCLKMLTNRGMFENQAEQVLERALPEIEIGNYEITWNRPASEYPEPLYAVINVILNKVALEWIDENLPEAWFRPFFMHGLL